MIRTIVPRFYHQTRLNICKRFCHTKSSDLADRIENVRVRFAPSPTGYLHLGGLRTALFNYLFARANKGTFIVRIEDTDQSRLVPDAVDTIFRDLDWAGITPDESEFHGGKYGPYMQSDRLNLYRSEVKKLLENGSAYYCFCTERRLELLRRDAIRANQVPKYDNRCRHLTPVQIAEKIANNDQMCIRFKLESHIKKFNDIVCGEHECDVASNEGDPIIIKSDGFPTYHFANVIDDHHMDISHVLRGIEWLGSTTKHLLLYHAFGWKPPQYAHLPLIMNADGTKLSKRHGNVNIEYFRSKGVFPLALINYITLSGGGFKREPNAKPKCYSLDELTEMFDLSIVGRNSCRLDPLRLDECNHLELINRINNKEQRHKLIAEIKDLVQQKFPNEVKNLHLNDEHIEKVLEMLSCRLSYVSDLVDLNLAFLWILPKLDDLQVHKNFDAEKLIAELEKIKFDKKDIIQALREFSEKNEINFKELMSALRSLLSGLSKGPQVAEMMEMLGKNSTFERIRRINGVNKAKKTK